MASGINTADKEFKDKTMDIILHEVHDKFVSIKEEDFEYYFNIFDKVFKKILEAMSHVDYLFGRYPTKIRHVGSHYDDLKIGKPNEFDMDIVMTLPSLMESNLTLEQVRPGLIMLEREHFTMNLTSKPDEVSRDWWDQCNFLLQFSIRNWVDCMVQKAFDTFPKNKYGERIVKVDNAEYTVRSTKGDPALLIQIRSRNEKEFGIDIDLVPAIEFSWSRLPSSLRKFMQCTRAMNLYVVPSPAELIEDDYLRNRIWKCSFAVQEKEILDNIPNMKPIIRLVKQLRDHLGMTLLSSYAIKALFLSESDNTELWRNNNYAKQFEYMLRKLHQALKMKMIQHYWYKQCNLLHSVENYADIVKHVLDAVECNNKELLLTFLVTDIDLQEYLM